MHHGPAGAQTHPYPLDPALNFNPARPGSQIRTATSYRRDQPSGRSLGETLKLFADLADGSRWKLSSEAAHEKTRRRLTLHDPYSTLPFALPPIPSLLGIG